VSEGLRPEADDEAGAAVTGTSRTSETVVGAALPSETGLPDPDARVARRVVARARAYLEGHRGSPVIDVSRRVLARHREIAGSLLAGALAYRLFLVTLPLAVMAVGLLGFGEQTATAGPEEVTKRLGIGGLMAQTVTTTAEDAVSLRWFTLVGGFVVLLWTTHALLRALRTVHAFAWRLPIERLQKLPRATLVATFVMLASSAASAGVNGATADWPFVALPANAVMFVAYVGVWIWLTRFLPSRAERWTDLLPGAVVFAVGVNLIRVFTIYYVGPFLNERAATYGALGYASMALLTLYAFGELAILSALLSAAMAERRREAA
jgi:uncharacterized BrkB/YihY/UPF0761 family membrane protein